MGFIIGILGAGIGSGIMAIVLAMLQRRWANSDKSDAIVAGLKVLTVDSVRYLGKCYIEQKEITLDDKENLQEMYRAYKALGGNGHLETVMNEVNGLPVVTHEHEVD